MLASGSGDVALVFVELGAIILALSVLARVSDRFGVSPVPAYLIAGLAFGDGGLVSPAVSGDFIEQAAEIGVVLLLLTLGLEYSAADLTHSLRRGWPAGLVDLALSFPPGLIAGLVLGWDFTAAILLGGVTYISSSGIVAKVLSDLGRLGSRETPSVLTILVIEDLAMAVYLPVVGVLLAGDSVTTGVLAVTVAVSMTVFALFVVLRHGRMISRFIGTRSDEALLLGVLGLTLLVAGLAEAVQVSAAVGAFLVGIAISGPVQERAAVLVGPLRDFFAAAFFLLFSLRIDPGSLPAVLPAAVILAIVTGATKFVTGRWSAARSGVGRKGQLRAGTVLMARGEFSIVIAGLAVGSSVAPDLAPLSAAYVLLMATAAPLLTRWADPIRRGSRVAPAGDP